MSDKKVIEKIKEYLKDNKQSESLDIQTDSEHLLFWIENWELQLEDE
tara:strand:+ start:17 stop:157 length:141 start_codon:yes stop_codon:yes gene_type:complete